MIVKNVIDLKQHNLYKIRTQVYVVIKFMKFMNADNKRNKTKGIPFILFASIESTNQDRQFSVDEKVTLCVKSFLTILKHVSNLFGQAKNIESSVIRKFVTFFLKNTSNSNEHRVK